MSTDPEPSNLPAQIAEALVLIPKGMVPGVLKALDRLLAAAVDVPVAWLTQKKAKIDAQTESFRLVESSIAGAVAIGAAGDRDTAERAMSVLVRKEYRKQINREGVAAAMLEDMRDPATNVTAGDPTPPTTELDEDWLNVFERYAEDASSDRLQDLWGRVLAGEIRKPGRFSTRTLRFLSEFSQADALTFEEFAKCAFKDTAPSKLVKPEVNDLRDLIYLESSGLIQGVTGLGLSQTIHFNESGYWFVIEGDISVVFKGDPNAVFKQNVVALTPLGQELLSLVTNRNTRDAARAVALASRCPEIHECYLGILNNNGSVRFTETLWLKETPEAPIIDGAE